MENLGRIDKFYMLEIMATNSRPVCQRGIKLLRKDKITPEEAVVFYLPRNYTNTDLEAFKKDLDIYRT